MGIDFDINEYVKSLKNAEPPFKCAVEGCEKSYRFVYIAFPFTSKTFSHLIISTFQPLDHFSA